MMDKFSSTTFKPKSFFKRFKDMRYILAVLNLLLILSSFWQVVKMNIYQFGKDKRERKNIKINQNIKMEMISEVFVS
jgi:hypothetical protein